MSSAQKIIQAAAGNAGAVDKVFSTTLYQGTGQELTVTNDVDLENEGGLVWIKDRDSGGYNALFDTERGFATDLGYPSYYKLESNSTAAQARLGFGFKSVSSDGFTIGHDDGAGTNACDNNLGLSGNNFASWTFRKAPKFFDVVTWTGNGASSRAIPHSLNADPGCIIIKRTDATADWMVWHRTTAPNSAPLNSTAAFSSSVQPIFGSNSAEITVNQSEVGSQDVNTSGGTYVAYLFAHNDGDGEFGETGDQDIIKCGSFTDSATLSVNLGFEPQWLLVRATDIVSNWWIFDTQRGYSTSSTIGLAADTNGAETNFGSAGYFAPTSTGFGNNGFDFFGAGENVIYIAIGADPTL